MYTIRRLLQAKHADLAGDLQQAVEDMTAKGRAWEDSMMPVQIAMADRDAADDELDGVTRDIHRSLIARKADAAKTKPYTDIFPDGLKAYVAAPLAEEVNRLSLMRQRLQANLAADDPLIVKDVPRLESGLAAFNAAVAALEQTRRDSIMARAALETAEDDWRVLMNRVYAILLSQLGREPAEHFFQPLNRHDQSGEADHNPPEPPAA